jgi:hypothetical protein
VTLPIHADDFSQAVADDDDDDIAVQQITDSAIVLHKQLTELAMPWPVTKVNSSHRVLCFQGNSICCWHTGW